MRDKRNKKKSTRFGLDYLKKKNIGRSVNLKKGFVMVAGLVVVMFVFLLVNSSLTGKISLESESFQVSEENFEGDMKLVLEKNEFIPASTKVVIEVDDDSYEYLLSELVTESVSQDNFYIKGKSVYGMGEGYGKSLEYASVSFVLDIFSEEETKIDVQKDIELESKDEKEKKEKEVKIKKEKKISGGGSGSSNVEEEPVEEEPVEEEPVEEEPVEEEPVEEEPVEEEIDSCGEYCAGEGYDSGICRQNKKACDDNDETRENGGNRYCTGGEGGTCCCAGSGGITGNVIGWLTGNVILKERVKEEITADEMFIYELSEGESAELVSSSQKVNLKIRNNQAIVTTDYSKKTGKSLSIDFGKLNIPIGEGKVKISLVYDDEELFYISKKIKVKEKKIIKEIGKNISIFNETTGVNTTIETIQYGAVLNVPVKWKKNVKVDKLTNISVEIPKEAENITVYKIGEDIVESASLDISVEGGSEANTVEGEISEAVEEIPTQDTDSSVSVEAGGKKREKIKSEIKVIRKEKENKGFIEKTFNSITGNVIEITESEEVKEVFINENVTEFEIEYETPGPVAFESPLGDDSGEPENIKGKIITISSEVHYENILAYTGLPYPV
ncbi:MAG: hypothetical protein ABIG28_01360, partial [archaeon]